MTPIPVLLVDDNPAFLRMATRFLQEHCGSVVVVAGVAGGGEEALVKAQDLRPEVVLLDLAMPDLPGLEVIPRLRAALPEVGIVVLTLLDVAAYRQAALEAGADGFVSKATLGTNLLPAIQQAVQARSSRRKPGEGHNVV